MSTAFPRTTARVAGFFYLMVFVTGGAALFIGGKLVKSGDPAATAANILAHEPRVQLGFAVNLISGACYIVVTALFYKLFKPVNSSVSLVAAFFSLVGCAVGAVSCLFYLAPLAVLSSTQHSSAFQVEQLQGLALIFLKLQAWCGSIGLVFFGFYCLMIGFLIVRSTFLPRILGVLMAIAGLGWLTFLSPPLANQLAPYNLLPGIVGEGLLTLWLLVMGVNVQRWHEQVGAAHE